jgi:hypothetical protein
MTIGEILQVLVVIGGSLGVIFGVVFVLAMVIETTTEFVFEKLGGLIGGIFPGAAVVLEKPTIREGVIALFACGVGIWAAFLYKLDLIYLISEFFATILGTKTPFTLTIFGLIATGIMMGMGASYLHEAWLKPLRERGKQAGDDGARQSG